MERRSAPRLGPEEPGKVVLNPRIGSVECTIAKVSMRGAQLAFSRPTFLPRKFELWFESGHRTWVRLVWQRGSHAGVQFETPLRRLAPKPSGFLSRLIGARP